MARKIPVADVAIAEAALDQISQIYYDSGLGEQETPPFQRFLLECASKVRFQPSTRQLVLTFDLDMSGDTSPSGTVTPIKSE